MLNQEDNTQGKTVVHKRYTHGDGTESTECNVGGSRKGFVNDSWAEVTCYGCRNRGEQILRETLDEYRKDLRNRKHICFDCGGYVQAIDGVVMLEFVPEKRRQYVVTTVFSPPTLYSECHCSMWTMTAESTEWIRTLRIPFPQRTEHTHRDRLFRNLDDIIGNMETLTQQGEPHYHVVGSRDDVEQALHVKAYIHKFDLITLKFRCEKEYYDVRTLECRQNDCTGDVVDKLGYPVES